MGNNAEKSNKKLNLKLLEEELELQMANFKISKMKN